MYLPDSSAHYYQSPRPFGQSRTFHALSLPLERSLIMASMCPDFPSLALAPDLCLSTYYLTNLPNSTPLGNPIAPPSVYRPGVDDGFS